MRAGAAMSLVLVPLAVAGCGPGGGVGRGAGPPATSPEATFVRDCGSCHTLSSAGTHGTAAKNLDDVRPSAAAVLQAIRTGPGGMPADLVRGREAALVARYVARATR